MFYCAHLISHFFFLTLYALAIIRAALASCGWAGKFDLINVLAECEALGEYERSAALAVSFFGRRRCILFYVWFLMLFVLTSGVAR